MELEKLFEPGYKCKECNFFTSTIDDIQNHVSDSHKTVLAKRQKLSDNVNIKNPNGDKKWKDVFQVTVKEVTETILGSLDYETFLACRLVCQDWRKAVNKYHPMWRKIKKTDFQESLQKAVVQGHTLVAEMLISNAANVTLWTTYGQNAFIVPHSTGPLHLAAGEDNLSMVEMLISNGANVNQKDMFLQTPLHRAARLKKSSIVDILLSNGADVDSRDCTHKTPLGIAARDHMLCVKIVRSLLRHGAHIDSEIILEAIRGGDSVVVEELVTNANENVVNSKDKQGKTPLILASRLGYSEIVKCLLKHGAHVDSVENYGWTALHIAANKGHLSIAEVLISHGASVNCQNINGYTPLHVSNAAIVELLCSHGAFVNTQDMKGNTPLHYVADVATVELLHSHGADVNARNMQNYTPLKMSQWNKEVVAKLKSLGATE